jgi:signal transduction histidine kinase
MRETEAPDTLLSSALRQLPAGVVVVEAATGNVVLVNEEVERLTGVRLEPGLPFAHHDWPLVRALATGEKVEEEIEVASSGGRRARLVVSAAPIRDGEGQIVAAVATLFDVTETRRTRDEAIPGEPGASRTSRVEARFRDVDHRRDEFLAMLAHDLRNPLAPLRNWLEVLKLHPCEERTVERAREAMVRQVQHLARRVDEILDVSRLTGG